MEPTNADEGEKKQRRLTFTRLVVLEKSVHHGRVNALIRRIEGDLHIRRQRCDASDSNQIRQHCRYLGALVCRNYSNANLGNERIVCTMNVGTMLVGYGSKA